MGRPRGANYGLTSTGAKRVDLRASLEGPFFAADPSKTVRGNIRDMMDALSAEMEKDVKAQISAAAGQMPGWSGWSLEHVVGRTASYSGKRWMVTAVVSENTNGMDAKTAIRTKAAGASIERRFHPFGRTSRAVRASRAVLAANLTKGIE